MTETSHRRTEREIWIGPSASSIWTRSPRTKRSHCWGQFGGPTAILSGSRDLSGSFPGENDEIRPILKTVSSSSSRRQVWRSQALPTTSTAESSAGRVEDEARWCAGPAAPRTHDTLSGACSPRRPSLRFFVPAHRTGRDHFGHPALGRVSRYGMRSGGRERDSGDRTPSSPKTTGMGNRR